MGAWETGIKDFAWSFGEFGTHFLKEVKRSFTLDEKFEAVNNGRLDAVEKEETPEYFSLFSDD